MSPAPTWWTWALAQLGVAEHPGAGSNERVLAYRKAAKLSGIKGDDSVVPWCVSGRTLITTPDGFVRADDIEVGAHVLGPSGATRRVVATASRLAPTLRLRWHGGTLEVTAEHPLLVQRESEEQWIPAGDVGQGDRVLIVRPKEGTTSFDADVAYALGMYVADGHSAIPPRREVHINDSHDQQERISKALEAANAPHSVNRRRTCSQFNIHRSQFGDMCQTFGRVSVDKQADQVLAWNRQARGAFLEGYCAGDGSVHEGRVSCTTVSMRLAFGIAAIVRSLDMRASVRRYERDPNGTIEGRSVTLQPEYWVVEWRTVRPQGRHDQSKADDQGRGEWVRVKEAPLPTGDVQPVYDFTIEDEHAFIANGIAVHNCAIFVGAALESTGHRSTRSAAARSYADWGQALKRPVGGCIVPLWRGSPNGALGHVGLLRAVSRDKQYVCLLGGNQGDKVSMAWFPASRVLGYRWPVGVPVPTGPAPVLDHGRPAKVTEV